MQRNTKHYPNGFTLIELAFVMIIIGFIVAGVLTAADIRRSAQLDSVIKDVEEYKSVIQIFEDTYSALPGDIIDGGTVWGASADGNGNGQIETGGEDVRAWHQMQLAKLIEGSYTGTLDGGDVTPGVNLPESKITSAGYWLRFFAAVYTTTNENMINFGVKRGNFLDGSALNSQEAWQIDSKIDDGLAATGIVMTQNGSGDTGCINTTPTPDEYELTNEAVRCQMFFTLE